MPPLMSQSAYARHRGVSRQAVSKAVKSGRVTLLDDGRIDSESADAAWAARSDPSKGGAHPSPTPRVEPPPAAAEPGPEPTRRSKDETGFASARAVRESYMARLARLDYEERMRSLLPADEVRMSAFKSGRRARDLLLAIPDRIAPILAGQSDQFEIHKILRQEFLRVCEEMSHVTASI